MSPVPSVQMTPVCHAQCAQNTDIQAHRLQHIPLWREKQGMSRGNKGTRCTTLKTKLSSQTQMQHRFFCTESPRFPSPDPCQQRAALSRSRCRSLRRRQRKAVPWMHGGCSCSAVPPPRAPMGALHLS